LDKEKAEFDQCNSKFSFFVRSPEIKQLSAKILSFKEKVFNEEEKKNRKTSMI